jgi:hypothetical protein
MEEALLLFFELLGTVVGVISFFIALVRYAEDESALQKDPPATRKESWRIRRRNMLRSLGVFVAAPFMIIAGVVSLPFIILFGGSYVCAIACYEHCCTVPVCDEADESTDLESQA